MCTVVQALRLCTGRTDHRGSRGIALLFLGHDTRTGRWVSVTARPLFTPGKDPVPTVQEAGWAPGPVWRGAENPAPTGIRFWTVQPVTSPYTDCATRPTVQTGNLLQITYSIRSYLCRSCLELHVLLQLPQTPSYRV